MKKSIIVLISGLILFAGFAGYIFYPRDYGVSSFQASTLTPYWKLKTGSQIGYAFLPGKMGRQRFPIVYLHGGPGGFIHESILKSLEPLANGGYDIYAYDQVGSGSSARLANISEYTLERHKSDLYEIITTIGSPKVVLLAQSWGSILATSFLLDHPELIAQIVMTSPGPMYPINRESKNMKAPESFGFKAPMLTNKDAQNLYSIREKCIKWTAQVFGMKLVNDSQADDFFTYLNTGLKKSTVCDTTNILPSAGGGGYYAHLMTLKSLNEVDDPRPQLNKITLPLLILKGQCDNQSWGFTQEYLQYLSLIHI